jgi:NAD(P)-dependent dehydrogenase (short-subunit alcohol dehydrogenase family)
MSVLDSFRLTGKVAVVTGASKNIGLAISRAFAESGAIVVMAARGEELLQQEAAAIREQTGARVETVIADVSTEDGTHSLSSYVHSEFPQADILVNNAAAAGNTYGVDVLEISDDVWHQTFATNILGPYRLCRDLGKRMFDGGGGSIINVLSGSGFLPNSGLMPYGTTKAGLWMMTRYLSVELAPKVRVNGLVPGLTMADPDRPAAAAILEQFLPLIPMKRTAHPSEVAPAAVYLASDAATYTTGTVLFVNGGRPW